MSLPMKPYPRDKVRIGPLNAGEVLRAGVRAARWRWWHVVNWKRVGCWLRLGHQLPLVLDYHTLTCKRCGHSWTE